MAHIRQSRPCSGLGFEVKVFQALQVVPCSLGSGRIGTIVYCRPPVDAREREKKRAKESDRVRKRERDRESKRERERVRAVPSRETGALKVRFRVKKGTICKVV